ncbi:uncharacterized protein LOC118204459 isoform X2 [Stegodyphus dumicola]|nr:uncharacterized protein LOC118204459 isoform X2 [Stegodyphus dumicola]
MLSFKILTRMKLRQRSQLGVPFQISVPYSHLQHNLRPLLPKPVPVKLTEMRKVVTIPVNKKLEKREKPHISKSIVDTSRHFPTKCSNLNVSSKSNTIYRQQTDNKKSIYLNNLNKLSKYASIREEEKYVENISSKRKYSSLSNMELKTDENLKGKTNVGKKFADKDQCDQTYVRNECNKKLKVQLNYADIVEQKYLPIENQERHDISSLLGNDMILIHKRDFEAWNNAVENIAGNKMKLQTLQEKILKTNSLLKEKGETTPDTNPFKPEKVIEACNNGKQCPEKNERLKTAEITSGRERFHSFPTQKNSSPQRINPHTYLHSNEAAENVNAYFYIHSRIRDKETITQSDGNRFNNSNHFGSEYLQNIGTYDEMLASERKPSVNQTVPVNIKFQDHISEVSSIVGSRPQNVSLYEPIRTIKSEPENLKLPHYSSKASSGTAYRVCTPPPNSETAKFLAQKSNPCNFRVSNYESTAVKYTDNKYSAITSEKPEKITNANLEDQRNGQFYNHLFNAGTGNTYRRYDLPTKNKSTRISPSKSPASQKSTKPLNTSICQAQVDYPASKQSSITAIFKLSKPVSHAKISRETPERQNGFTQSITDLQCHELSTKLTDTNEQNVQKMKFMPSPHGNVHIKTGISTKDGKIHQPLISSSNHRYIDASRKYSNAAVLKLPKPSLNIQKCNEIPNRQNVLKGVTAVRGQIFPKTIHTNEKNSYNMKPMPLPGRNSQIITGFSAISNKNQPNGQAVLKSVTAVRPQIFPKIIHTNDENSYNTKPMPLPRSNSQVKAGLSSISIESQQSITRLNCFQNIDTEIRGPSIHPKLGDKSHVTELTVTQALKIKSKENFQEKNKDKNNIQQFNNKSTQQHELAQKQNVILFRRPSCDVSENDLQRWIAQAQRSTKMVKEMR